jgi:hypothetical protein
VTVHRAEEGFTVWGGGILLCEWSGALFQIRFASSSLIIQAHQDLVSPPLFAYLSICITGTNRDGLTAGLKRTNSKVAHPTPKVKRLLTKE